MSLAGSKRTKLLSVHWMFCRQAIFLEVGHFLPQPCAALVLRFFLPHGRAPTLQDTSFAPGYVLGRYGIASIYQHESWNTPMDKAHTTYSDPDSIQNQQFRDTSLANTWIQDDTLRFYSSSSDPVATWTYDTLNDHGTFLSNVSPQIQTPSDMTFSGGSDALGMLSDSNGHYYDVWDGTYEHPFISSTPSLHDALPIYTTYSDPDSIQNQQFRDTSLANTWIHNDTLRFYSSSSDPVATWTYDTLNDHGTFLSSGSLQINTPRDTTFFHITDAFFMLSDSN